ELAEQPLVTRDAGDLPVAQRRDLARERISPASEVALGDVVQQDQADRVGDRRQGGGVAGDAQALVDLLQQLVMVGEYDIFLGAVMAEKGRTAEAGALRDVVNGGLLVPALVEQGKGGLG